MKANDLAFNNGRGAMVEVRRHGLQLQTLCMLTFTFVSVLVAAKSLRSWEVARAVTAAKPFSGVSGGGSGAFTLNVELFTNGVMTSMIIRLMSVWFLRNFKAEKAKRGFGDHGVLFLSWWSWPEKRKLRE